MFTVKLCTVLEVWASYLEGLGTPFTTRCCWHQCGNTEEARKSKSEIQFYGSVVTSYAPPNSSLLQSPAVSQPGALLRCPDVGCFSLTWFSETGWCVFLCPQETSMFPVTQNTCNARRSFHSGDTRLLSRASQPECSHVTVAVPSPPARHWVPGR